MTTELELSKMDIPYGILHDQKLQKVICHDNTMRFTFDVQMFPDDYAEDIMQKFSPYTHCDMVVEMTKEPFNYFLLETAVDRHDRYRGRSLSRTDFLDVANHADEMTFLSCGVDATCREFHVLFGMHFAHPKGAYKKYRKYGMCRVELSAERVQWKWY